MVSVGSGGAGAGGPLLRLRKGRLPDDFATAGGEEAANEAETKDASGATGPAPGMMVCWQYGRGVIRVGVSVMDTLLAVTVTSKPSVTVT